MEAVHRGHDERDGVFRRGLADGVWGVDNRDLLFGAVCCVDVIIANTEVADDLDVRRMVDQIFLKLERRNRKQHVVVIDYIPDLLLRKVAFFAARDKDFVKFFAIRSNDILRHPAGCKNFCHGEILLKT